MLLTSLWLNTGGGDFEGGDLGYQMELSPDEEAHSGDDWRGRDEKTNDNDYDRLTAVQNDTVQYLYETNEGTDITFDFEAAPPNITTTELFCVVRARKYGVGNVTLYAELFVGGGSQGTQNTGLLTEDSTLYELTGWGDVWTTAQLASAQIKFTVATSSIGWSAIEGLILAGTYFVGRGTQNSRQTMNVAPGSRLMTMRHGAATPRW